MFGYWNRKPFGSYVFASIFEQYTRVNEPWYPYHSLTECRATSFLVYERAPARVPSMIPVNDPQFRVELIMWRMVVLFSAVEGSSSHVLSFKLLRLRHRSIGEPLKKKYD